MDQPQDRGFVRSDWIYNWRQPSRSLLHSWSALLLVFGMFAFLLLAVRIRIPEPVERNAPQASRLLLDSGDLSRQLAERASAEGPFPSRFEPAEWQGLDGLRADLKRSTEVELKKHQPRLLPFPTPAANPPRLARRGEPVLPERPLIPEQRPVDGNYHVVPVISVVDGIIASELPGQLPAWEGPIGKELSARHWRFLVEVEGSGRVRDCMALAGGGELNPPQLVNWIRGLVFRTKPREEGRRWVAIDVGFENRIIEGDGTDSH